MATLEVEIAPEELARLAQEAAREGVSMSDLARKRILPPSLDLEPPAGSKTWTLQDALDYADL